MTNWIAFILEQFYLQFFLIEGFEQVLRNNLIEAFLQGQKLSLNAMQETPVHIQPAENIREEEGEEAQRESVRLTLEGTANTDASSWHWLHGNAAVWSNKGGQLCGKSENMLHVWAETELGRLPHVVVTFFAFVCVRASLSIPDILLLGVLWDGDTLAVGFELMLDDFSVSIVLYTERMVQDASDVIVPEEEGGQV